MKFGKRLRIQTSDTLPEWSDKFISYKQLKKRLKTLTTPPVLNSEAYGVPDEDSEYSKGLSVPGAPTERVPGKIGEQQLEGASYEESWGRVDGSPFRDSPKSESLGADSPGDDIQYRCDVSDGDESEDGLDVRRRPVVLNTRMKLSVDDQREFIRLLNAELGKFNEFYMEKEEEFVIRLQFSQERINSVEKWKWLEIGPTCPPALVALRKDLLDLMGEMLLLLNYSNVNYLGLVKILKKHDKRLLTNLRLPFITTVRGQPFTTTGLLKNLVSQCEETLQMILPPPPRAQGAELSRLGAAETRLVDKSGPSSSLTVSADSASSAHLDTANDSHTDPAHADTASAHSAFGVDGDGTPIYRSALAALKMLTAMMPGGGFGAEALAEGCGSRGSTLSALR